MCLNPILIKNKSRNHTVANSHDTMSPFKDTTSQYIEVKCGHCPECLTLKQSYIRQRAQLVSKDHDIFFTTLTYKPSMLPVMEVNGYKHQYADIRDFQNLVKRMRKMDFFGRPFKYIAVTEYGGKKHRPHFHILWFVEKNKNEDDYDLWNRTQFYYWALLKLWYRNTNEATVTKGAKKRVRVNTRNAIKTPLCDYVRDSRGRCTYDFHQVVPRRTKNGVDDVTTYVTKYVLKFDDWIVKKQQALHLNLELDEYKRVWNILKPRVLISKHFGDSEDYMEDVRKGIDLSIQRGNEYFWFVDSQTGKTMPLAPYLKRKFATMDDFFSMYYNNKSPDNIIELSDDYYGLTHDSRRDKFARTYLMIKSRNTDDFYELE